jgi:hypothetical protein
MRPSIFEGSTTYVRGQISVKRVTYRGFAEAWVDEAIVAGCDPHMRQEPLSSDGLAGEWLLVVSAAGLSNPFYPGSVPDEFLDEVFLILGRRGRIDHAQGLRPWHGNVLLDNISSRALLFRMKLIREALHLGCDEFYGNTGFPAGAAEAIESGRLEFEDRYQKMPQAVCLHYDVPEEWLTCGAAEEMELCEVE